MQRSIIFVGLFLCLSCQVFGVPVEEKKLSGVPVEEKKLFGVPVEEKKLIGVPVEKKKPVCQNKELYAVCNLVPNPNKPSFINGTILFMQPVNRDCTYDFLSVQVNIDNVPTNDGTDKHGFHVHEYGDMTGGCESMGGHYNPYNTTHGSPWHPLDSRHVGDLGNVVQNHKNGRIKRRIVDYLASLHGEETIIGRGIVLHAGQDDLGLNRSNPDSLKTGNAGGRLACCVIGRTPPIDKSMFTLYK